MHWLKWWLSGLEIAKCLPEEQTKSLSRSFCQAASVRNFRTSTISTIPHLYKSFVASIYLLGSQAIHKFGVLVQLIISYRHFVSHLVP